MQIEAFEVSGLFGAFDRVIPFSTHGDDDPELSLVLLHGPNGSGKTSSLRMIDGFMSLKFDAFRQIPFERSTLRFSTGDQITVSKEETGAPLHVHFHDHSVVLHPELSGPLERAEPQSVEEFRNTFFAAMQTISFEYIDTWRLEPRDRVVDGVTEHAYIGRPHARPRQRPTTFLADRVARFIANAQVNYRRFFRSNEPDFLSAIIERLQTPVQSDTSSEILLQRLAAVREQEDKYERLGVERDRWDFNLARDYLAGLSEPKTSEGLAVMAAAAEVLESRAREQKLLAERLLTFEEIANGYFRDKRVEVGPRKGLVITSVTGHQLREDSLSSGEYHLLYLMVAALTTQRRGTVLAIDEPELSMHISWQRRLIDSLRKCASNASPQMLLATHSPDIVGEYRDYLVEFGNADELVR